MKKIAVFFGTEKSDSNRNPGLLDEFIFFL